MSINVLNRLELEENGYDVAHLNAMIDAVGKQLCADYPKGQERTYLMEILVDVIIHPE